jgi:nucleoside-diphosphate-sugar epimerase
MKILVIGGTRYFGIHMVNKLLEQGHEVTIATRGKTPENIHLNSFMFEPILDMSSKKLYEVYQNVKAL